METPEIVVGELSSLSQEVTIESQHLLPTHSTGRHPVNDSTDAVNGEKL